MNSSLRSKIFLITYGTILAFIAGLIIFNNTILKDYYTYRRNTHLVEAYQKVSKIDLLADDFNQQVAIVESEDHLSILLVFQPFELDESKSLSELKEENIFNIVYGQTYWMSGEDVISFIYHYHQMNNDKSDFKYGRHANIDFHNDSYYFKWQRTNEIQSEDIIGLFSVEPYGEGYLFYFNTIPSATIDENIWIFSSFTVVIAILFMILSAVVMYTISYKLTNPILEINRVANEIANLNFSDKVQVFGEDEVGHLARSINKMSDQLSHTIDELKISNQRLADEILYKNQLEKKRKEFTASASHELKTPLSLIMGYSEALKLDDLSKEDRDNYLDIVIDETDKMNRLVRELLNITQIESGIITVNKTHFSILKLVQSTYQLLAIRINEKSIQLTLDVDDLEVYSDYDQLQTVLINFLNNAMNHVTSHGMIKIYSEKIENKLRINVYNSGKLIEEEDIDQLWDSFYKVDKARTRSYGGHGLGLSICKSIFEALDYSFGVKNGLDGVVFYFDINIVNLIEEESSI